MRGTLVLLAALCLAGNLGVSGGDAMGHLHWCNTLCMCRDSTQVEVKCFERSDVYELLGFGKIQVFKLERTNWKLENQVEWCNDTCLCHQNTNPKVFRCIDEDTLHQFISEKIGDMYFYVDGEAASDGRGEEEEEVEVQTQEIEHRRRSEERRKNGRKRKSRKRGKGRQQERPTTVVTEMMTTTSTTALTPEVIEVVTTPPTEVVSVTTTPEVFSLPPTTPTPEILTSEMPTQVPTTSETTITFLTTEQTPFESLKEHPETEMVEGDETYEEEEEEEEEEEDAAEFLPKQEAVAASPAVTAMQPPTRRQPFPPTAASSQAANRETETMAPKVSAVLEVPVQRKTVASEVSQDLDELGSAVMQIKSDVVLNQRILLVTVVVAGIAMLGVLILAFHGCFASRRQAAAEEERRKNESPKADNHVTKVNLEEAW